MDMYQKRELRKNNKNSEKESSAININCLIPIYVNPRGNLYK